MNHTDGIDIDAVHRRRPYIAKGLDQQGHYPEAAHAASELDEDRNAQPLPWYVSELIGVPPAIVTALALVLAIIFVVGCLHWALS